MDQTGNVVQVRPVAAEPPLRATRLTEEWVVPDTVQRVRPDKLIDRYIDVAMRRAFTEQLEDGSWYAEVKVLKGVWATGETEGEALSELRSVIAGWIELKVDKGHRDFPVLGGIDLNRIVRAP